MNHYSRRQWLRGTAGGFGWLAMTALAQDDIESASASPLIAKAGHHAATAKRIIFLCMRGGTNGGLQYGATDDHGYEAVEGRVHVHDLHATILDALGLDHTQLTFRYAGRDFRLTDVAGRVVREVLA